MKNTISLFISLILFFLTGCKDDMDAPKYIEKVENFDFELNYEGVLHQFEPSDIAQTLKLHFKGCKDLDINIDVEVTQLVEGLSIGDFLSNVFITSEDFIYEIPIVGTPVGFGEFKVNVIVSGVTPEPVVKEFVFNVEEDILEPVDPITITKIEFYGPIVNGKISDSYQLKISYEGGTEGTKLNVASVTGYLVPDDTKLQSVSAEVGNGTGEITFDLGTDFFASSTYQPAENMSAGIDREIEIALKYNSEDVSLSAELSKITFKSNGFVWNGYSYNEIKIGEQIWLDRNLGATSNNIEKPTTDTDKKITGWNPNFNTYGHYYQRGRKTGIPLQSAETNPTPELAGQPWFQSSKNGSGTEEDWTKGFWTKAIDNSKTADIWSAVSEYNPCPRGYTVPSVSDFTKLIEELLKFKAELANNKTFSKDVNDEGYLDILMTSELRIPLAGAIGAAGPSSMGIKNTGQEAMVGLPGLDKDSPYAPVTTAEKGEIRLICSDLFTNEKYPTMYLGVSNSVISIKQIGAGSTIPVRAIKIQQ